LLILYQPIELSLENQGNNQKGLESFRAGYEDSCAKALIDAAPYHVSH
jgi:hypothetical protein